MNEEELELEITNAENAVYVALMPNRLGDIDGPTEYENRAAWTLAKAWMREKGWMG